MGRPPLKSGEHKVMQISIPKEIFSFIREKAFYCETTMTEIVVGILDKATKIRKDINNENKHDKYDKEE